VASVSSEIFVFEIIGINLRRLSSSAAHIRSQFALEIAMIVLIKRVDLYKKENGLNIKA
jgi:hypothetical protein